MGTDEPGAAGDEDSTRHQEERIGRHGKFLSAAM
jgi:hypothetical protein